MKMSNIKLERNIDNFSYKAHANTPSSL